SGQVVKETTHFPLYVMDSLLTPALKYINITDLYSNTAYNLQSARKVQDSTVTTTYDPATTNSVTTMQTTYFGSRFHHHTTLTVTLTSTGDSLITVTKYVNDFRIASCDATPDSLAYYTSQANADSSLFFIHLDSCSAPDWTCRLDTFSNLRRH